MRPVHVHAYAQLRDRISDLERQVEELDLALDMTRSELSLAHAVLVENSLEGEWHTRCQGLHDDLTQMGRR